MLIQKRNELDASKKMALEILEKGLDCAMPYKTLPKFVKKNQIIVDKKTINLSRYDNVYLVAFGKAADSMAKSVNNITKINGGLIVVPKGTKPLIKNKKLRLFFAGHPIPNTKSYQAGRAIKKFVEERKENDFIIFLVSGGASSLVCMPEGITLEEKKQVNDIMIKSSATVQEINCVRKHLSAIKGGKLVQNLRCDAISFVMSDVIDDDLSSIASGYTYYDKTTFDDALRIIKKYNLGKLVSKRIIDRLKDGIAGKIAETPKHPQIKNVIIAKNNDLLEIMSKKSKQLGFFTKTASVSGNVKAVAKKLITMTPKKPKSCLIFGGEPTVNVVGNGKGGRNQELVLHILLELQKTKKQFIVASLGTDGIDGNTKFAGAIINTTRVKPQEIQKYLKNNDSNSFFKKYGGLIRTGYTHTNLMDIGIIQTTF